MSETKLQISVPLLPMLVCDVGGTNARFALLSEGSTSFHDEKVLQADDYPQFIDAVQAYLNSVDLKPITASIAIAGPVTGDTVRLTNRDWAFSIADLKENLELDRLEVINDFKALAMSLPFLADDELLPLGPEEPIEAPFAPRVVIGPGTGLGVATLAQAPGGYMPLPGEGGHVSFAPTTPMETRLLTNLTEKLGRVSYEDILSGRGLEALFQALLDIGEIQGVGLTAPQITEGAKAGEAGPTLCMDAFCAILGAYAGDLALIASAHGGVYIGGGILPRVPDILAKGPMRERFESKGPMSHFVKGIPTYLITAKFPALTGAAAFLERQHRIALMG